MIHLCVVYRAPVRAGTVLWTQKQTTTCSLCWSSWRRRSRGELTFWPDNDSIIGGSDQTMTASVAEMIRQWQHHWADILTRKWQHDWASWKPPDNDSIIELGWSDQIWIFRLRSGHYKFIAHGHRIGLTVICNCEAPKQNLKAHPTRLLRLCQTREKVWPKGATLQDKLLENGEGLKCTVLFVTHTEVEA